MKRIVIIACLTVVFSAVAYAENDGGPAAKETPAATVVATRGVVFCTATINADGTVAGGFGVNRAGTTHPNPGVYNVKFVAPCVNIQAANGWSRWTQVDTLGFGTTSGSCHTADLALDPAHGVWVNCEDETGARADRSFFLFVAR
jgi:hypothetical protein